MKPRQAATQILLQGNRIIYLENISASGCYMCPLQVQSHENCWPKRPGTKGSHLLSKGLTFSVSPISPALAIAFPPIHLRGGPLHCSEFFRQNGSFVLSHCSHHFPQPRPISCLIGTLCGGTHHWNPPAPSSASGTW